MSDRDYYVYIMTNKRHTVLYTGITRDLRKRVWEHKEKMAEGFTTRYNIDKLVYYEICGDALGAITREKQLKAGSRKRKLDLIDGMNREWRDLYNEL